MWTITEMKERGKAAFKANYWPSVLCAFLLMLLAGGTSVSINATKQQPKYSTEDINNMVNGMTPEQQLATAGIVTGFVLVIIAVAVVLQIFLFNPLKVGCLGFFKENAKSVGHGELAVVKSGFQSYGRTFLTMFLTDLFLTLWSLLFVIPGFIKAYSYRMVPYIIRDNPELSPTEVITRSREMMNGHKMNTFVFDMSFLGWIILGIVTCGLVQIFWTGPYKDNADAALYLRLSQQA